MWQFSNIYYWNRSPILGQGICWQSKHQENQRHISHYMVQIKKVFASMSLFPNSKYGKLNWKHHRYLKNPRSRTWTSIWLITWSRGEPIKGLLQKEVYCITFNVLLRHGTAARTLTGQFSCNARLLSYSGAFQQPFFEGAHTFKKNIKLSKYLHNYLSRTYNLFHCVGRNKGLYKCSWAAACSKWADNNGFVLVFSI